MLNLWYAPARGLQHSKVASIISKVTHSCVLWRDIRGSRAQSPASLYVGRWGYLRLAFVAVYLQLAVFQSFESRLRQGQRIVVTEEPLWAGGLGGRTSYFSFSLRSVETCTGVRLRDDEDGCRKKDPWSLTVSVDFQLSVLELFVVELRLG